MQEESCITLVYLLLAVTLHFIQEAAWRGIDVEYLHHLLINGAKMQHIWVQQRPHGPHGDGPVQKSAADKHTAANQDFLFLETDSDILFVLIGPGKSVLGELLDLFVDPEGPTYGFYTPQTCKKMQTIGVLSWSLAINLDIYWIIFHKEKLLTFF